MRARFVTISFLLLVPIKAFSYESNQSPAIQKSLNQVTDKFFLDAIVEKFKHKRLAKNPDFFESMFYLEVDKSTGMAELKTWEENPSISRTLSRFKVAFGKVKGDKFKQGDNRTPEGIYFAREHILTGLPTKKYGPYAITLDFPNPIDVLERKTGYGIWLHGAGDDQRIEKKNVTEGCVAFYNSEIIKVKDWIIPHQAAVLITKDSKNINKVSEISSLGRVFKKWLKTWQTANLAGYLTHYHSDFKLGFKDLAQFKRYKRRVFGSYKTMKVDADGVKHLTHEKYAVTAFNQSFQGDERYKSRGSKVLYWKRDGESWKIVREIFSRRVFKPMSFGKNRIENLLSRRNQAKNFTSKKSDEMSKQ